MTKQIATPTSTPTPTPTSTRTDGAVPMSHREILTALSGLLLAMFVAMLSSTVVSNALPRIVADLHGSQTGYTWVVVATLLAMTATTPIWGKLADLFDKKLLVQLSLGIYAAGSLIAAFAPSMGVLITARVVQGLGVGGLTALVQVVIASMVSPRERGRYSGYIGAVFATATVSGPLIGGVLVDSPLGWRGCFFVGLPFALVAFVVLQRTLHLPALRAGSGHVQIDYAGATLLMAGVSSLLIWVSLAGSSFAWGSTASIGLVALGVVLLTAALVVEARFAAQPIIPLRLFRDRTTSLATAASVMIGVAMFGATVYLSQYFQLAHGMSPTEAGLMSVAMVGGLLVSSIGTGRIISRTGLWKRWLVGGLVLVVVGLVLLGRIDAQTSLLQVGASMALVGLGLGATMQNLVLAVQNNVAQADMGAASSLVSFFRSLGGSIGVSALGALLTHQVSTDVAAGGRQLISQGVPAPQAAPSGGGIPDLSALPEPWRTLYETAFGSGIGHVFALAVPFAILALVCVLFIKEVPLRTSLDLPAQDDASGQPEQGSEQASEQAPQPVAAAGSTPVLAQGQR